MQAAEANLPDDWSLLDGRVERIASHSEAYDFFRQVTAEAGFRHFTLLNFRPASSPRPSQILLTSLPEGIVRDYAEARTTATGAALGGRRQTVSPFLWDQGTVTLPRAGNDNVDLRALLSRLGVSMGLNIPVFSWRPGQGMAIFAGDRSTPGLDEIARLTLVSNMLFDRVLAIEIGDHRPGDFRLTARERQCLTWTSAGKTSAEIAAILGLSEHTVNQYITASSQKLGAVNRTQAVAKAIRLRLID